MKVTNEGYSNIHYILIIHTYILRSADALLCIYRWMVEYSQNNTVLFDTGKKRTKILENICPKWMTYFHSRLGYETRNSSICICQGFWNTHPIFEQPCSFISRQTFQIGDAIILPTIIMRLFEKLTPVQSNRTITASRNKSSLADQYE